MQGRITIDGERCKGCLFCIELCPKKSIHLSEELNLKGYFVAAFDGADGGDTQCNGCGTCAAHVPGSRHRGGEGMKRLMSGNAALGEAAILSGCTAYFGYPITPQNELTEHMAKRMVESGGVFIQSESEIAAINMVLGASAAGARAMTSSSGPGISLKQEGISYLVADELPAVIVNMARGGPGMGNISPSQSDYFQATRGGGHGDYKTIVLAPGLRAGTHRDRAAGLRSGRQVPQSGAHPGRRHAGPDDGAGGLRRSAAACGLPEGLHPDRRQGPAAADHLLAHLRRQAPGRAQLEAFSASSSSSSRTRSATRPISPTTRRWWWWPTAWAPASRRAPSSGCAARGIKVGLVRPITLWPFPTKVLQDLSATVNDFFVFEMSAGQMVEDVRLALGGKGNVHFYGRPGGVIPMPVELYRIVSRHYYQAQSARGGK